MSDNQETIIAIIQEMNYGPIPKHKLDIELLRHYADRLVAAYRRVMVNMHKMRDALEYVLHFDATDEAAMEDGLTDAERIAEYADHIAECQKKAKEALAAPPRNCDVGTPEEQLDRYGLFRQEKCLICESRHSCHICGERYRMKCMMKWAQMPYESTTEGSPTVQQEEGK